MHRPSIRSTLACALVWLAACADDVSEAGSADTTGSGETTTDTPTTTLTTATTTADTSGSESSGPSTTTPAESSSDGSSSGPTTDTDTASTGTDGSSSDGSSSDGSSSDGSSSAEGSSSDGGAVCDNGAIEDGEVCDTDDLGGQDCLGLDFDAGVLACAADCASFDTSGCIMFSCGNDLLEGMELCDGTDLGNQDCGTQGFDGGVLACADNCGAFDVSGCYVCGDDLVGGPEACDGSELLGQDCLTQGFDGGDLSCALDCSAFDTTACTTCGNDLIEGAEVCDGDQLDGNTCESEGFDGGTLACASDCGAVDTSGCTTCGDGSIEGDEDCEGMDLGGANCISQGGDFGTLGCASDCSFNLASCIFVVDEIEPNDDGAVAIGTNDFLAANANGPFTVDTFIGAAISPVGDDDVFAVNNPSAGYALLRLETFGPGGPGTCAVGVDTVVEIRTAANTLITSNDEGGIASCSLIQNFLLAPGETVYVRVIDFLDNTAIASYFLDIQIDPIVCGDGVAGAGEQCDDGDLDDGDGCSATCVAEAAIQEIEPNGTNLEADATGIVSAGSTLFGGSIGAVGDLDRFRVDLAAPGFVRLETFSSVNDCAGITTTLRLFDAVGAQIIADAVALGIGGCSALTFPLPAGTFYVQVEETGNNAVVPTYLLEVQTQADLGTETEPNELIATASANIQAAGSNVYVFGDHTLNVDSDFYAIDVPVSGSSLRLETIEGDRTVETCESNGIDSRLTLFDALGVQLSDDDDEGRGFCSIIDGTGTTALDTGANNLAAGTYFVQVRASTFSQAGAAGQFTYRLVATVRQP